jgi:hypothetical protein
LIWRESNYFDHRDPGQYVAGMGMKTPTFTYISIRQLVGWR